ncbi:MAG: nucleoside hydrolase [Planctomycetes bacterium]|nr:nucleoside hydrolase [Planctomycetota bacterium]
MERLPLSAALLTCLSLVAAVALVAASAAAGEASGAKVKPIPVIFDTDIGDDIDDTWALSVILKSPEFDVKLVVGDEAKTEYRARLLAKLLQTAGRTDIPVGMGVGSKDGEGRQADWVKDYRLEDYPGTVHQDGIGAMIKTIMEAEEPITIIATGPVPNLEAALAREPKIAAKARFVGMHGSVRKGYKGKDTPDAEYNVRAAPAALQAVFAAPWPKTITPLDTCGLVQLKGEKYAKIRDAKDPLLQALITNYRIWCGKNPERADTASSILFDTVAVYLALRDDLCKMETLPLRVTPEGMTVIDAERGHKVRVATEWKDLGKFEDWLVERLLRPTVKP